MAADDAAEGDDGGGGQAGFEGVCDALPQKGMRNRRLVDRAEGEMIILRLQPREQIARNRSEEHTSELQSLMRNSYAVFCLKKKMKTKQHATAEHSHTRLAKR